MWNRVVPVNRQAFLSSSKIFKRLQSSTQFYPISDESYGFTDDQKEVASETSIRSPSLLLNIV